MTTPLPNEQEIHQAIINVLSEATWEAVEHATDNAAWLKEFNAAIDAIKPYASPDVVRVLEQAPFRLSQPFGESMFALGVQLGRNPYSLMPTGVSKP